jgi:hypothetical protein
MRLGRSGGWSGREVECSRLEIELPLTIRQLRVHLADAALPVKVFSDRLVPPESIDVDHGERPVPLLGDLDPDRVALIPDQIVSVEDVLPALTPAIPVESSQDEDSVDRIMGISGRRPRPDHVRVDHGEEEVRILCVPAGGFEIHQFLDLSRDSRALIIISSRHIRF